VSGGLSQTVMMKPLASFLMLLLCSTVHSKSSSRADKISQRSGVLPKTAVIRENEGTATVVKLLRARKTYFEGAFILSHIVALIKCITTVDILFKDPSLPLDSAVNSALGSSIGDLSILPAASLQSFYSFFQVILSLSCHIGYNYMLRQFPSLRELICFAETSDLRVATAALVLKEEAGWGDAVSNSCRVIVPLQSSEMLSVSQCLSRLQVTASSAATQNEKNAELFSREFADRERITYTTEAREVEVDDIKLFLFQRSKQKPTVKVSQKTKSRIELSKVKRKKKKISKEGLTVVAAVPNCNIHLKELKEIVSRMGRYDEQLRDKEKLDTEDMTSDAVVFGLTADTAIERLKLYGGNRITVRPPSVRERLASRFLSSAYIMNTFFQFLSILEESIQNPLRRIAMSAFMDAGDILRDSNSAKRLEREVSSTTAQDTLSSSLSSSARDCTVIRDSKEIQVMIEEIVPGDILCLMEGPVPADCLLLEGSCVVNEAFLTGEAVPQPRESIDYTNIDDKLESVESPRKSRTEGDESEDKIEERGRIEEEEDAKEGRASGNLCLLKYQKSVLYGGSEILQYTRSEDSHNRQPLRCLVLKTGFSSVQGVLVRKMKALGGKLNAPGAGSGLLTPALQRDASKLLAWLSVSALGFSLHVYRQGRLQGISRYRLLVQICRIIASVASPDIDKDITFTIRKSARRLTRMEEVYCTDPSKLAVAGLVTACLFDKTGTIATDIVVAGDAVTLCQGALPAGDADEELNAPTSHVGPLLYSPSAVRNVGGDIDDVRAEWSKQEWSLSTSPLGLQIVIATCHSAMELQSRYGTRSVYLILIFIRKLYRYDP
jgi:magnesium-transporting ATPase (P-type)